MEILLSAEPRIVMAFSELNGVYEFLYLEVVLVGDEVVRIDDSGFDYLPYLCHSGRSVADLLLSDRVFELRVLLMSQKLQRCLALARTFEQFYQA